MVVWSVSVVTLRCVNQGGAEQWLLKAHVCSAQERNPGAELLKLGLKRDRPTYLSVIAPGVKIPAGSRNEG
jgi:hypothetical protein